MTPRTDTMSPAGRSPAQSLFARLGAAARAVALEIRARRAIRAMQALDGQILHDIGVDRGAIESAVRSGRTRR